MAIPQNEASQFARIGVDLLTNPDHRSDFLALVDEWVVERQRAGLSLEPFSSDYWGSGTPTEEGTYEVEHIAAVRIRLLARGRYRAFFKIKWLGYPEEENTWEPAEHIDCLPGLLLAYYVSLRG